MKINTKPNLDDIPDWLMKMGPEGGIEFVDVIKLNPDCLNFTIKTTPNAFSDCCDISSVTTITPINDNSCEQHVKANVVVNHWIVGSIVQGLVASGITGGCESVPDMVVEFLKRYPSHPDLNVNSRKEIPTQENNTERSDIPALASMESEIFHDAQESFLELQQQEQKTKDKNVNYNIVRQPSQSTHVQSTQSSLSSQIPDTPHKPNIIDTTHTAFLDSLDEPANNSIFGFNFQPEYKTLNSSIKNGINTILRSNSTNSSNNKIDYDNVNVENDNDSDLPNSEEDNEKMGNAYYSLPSNLIDSLWSSLSSKTVNSKKEVLTVVVNNYYHDQDLDSMNGSDDSDEFSDDSSDDGQKNVQLAIINSNGTLQLKIGRRLSLYESNMLGKDDDTVHVMDCKKSFGKVLTHSMCTNIRTWTTLFEREKFQEIQCGTL
eukprot:Pgem_evm1s1219